MKFYFQKSKEVLSTETCQSSSTRFTWGEGSVETFTEYTTSHCKMQIGIYCDNPALYSKLGGRSGVIIEKKQNSDSYFGDNRFDYFESIGNNDILNYTQLRLFPRSFGRDRVFHYKSSTVVKPNPTEWIVLKSKNKRGDFIQFNYQRITVEDSSNNMEEVMAVTIFYSYTTEYSW